MRYPNLEIGCAEYADPRYDARLDIKPTSATTHTGDMRDMRAIFADNTFATVKCAATIEHVNWDDKVRTVNEIHRILIPHGVVHIQTPDEKWVNTLKDTDPEWFYAMVNGGMRDVYDFHKGLLDKESITRLLTENGFRVLQLHEGIEAGGSLDVLAEAI